MSLKLPISVTAASAADEAPLDALRQSHAGGLALQLMANK